MTKNYLSILCVSLLFCTTSYAQQVYYVDDDAAGNNDGTTWTDAFINLQSALSVAQPKDQIWVAEGMYKPTDIADTTASFIIPDSVEVYGSFAGIETELNQREWEMHLSILSGDIGVEGDSLDNVTNLVKIDAGQSGRTRLDGFVVEHAFGYNGQFSPRDWNTGGGIRVANASPVLENLIIRYNAAMYGGGLSIRYNAYPQISNVEFHHNYGRWGSGIWMSDISKSIEQNVLIDNVEAYNHNTQAVYIKDSYGYVLSNSNFWSNSVGLEFYRPNAGEISKVMTTGNSTGIQLSIAFMGVGQDSMVFKQVIAANNTNNQLSYNSTSDANGKIRVYNSTFFGNNSLNVSVKDSSNAKFWNCIFEGSKNVSEDDGDNDSPLFYHCVFDDALVIEGDSNVFDATDNFEDPLNGDFNIRNTSQAINVGTPMVLAILDEEDIMGNERNQSTAIDAGAVESSYSMVAVGFAEKIRMDLVDVYPSPFTSACKVTSAMEPVNVSVFDAQGVLVEEHSNILDVDVLIDANNGMFIIQVSNENGFNSYKVIKK